MHETQGRVESILIGFVAAAMLHGTTLDGRIVSKTGKPVSKAVVTVFRSPVDGLVANPLTYLAGTDDSGKFTLAIKDPGTYVICAGSHDDELLDSCAWPNDTAIVKIAAGQQNVRATVVIQPATTLRIRIEDQGGLLPTPTSSGKSTSLSVGVFSPGHYYPAGLVSTAGKSLNYEVLIPPNTDVKLSIEALGVHVIDSNNRDVGKAVNVAFHSQASESATVRRFSVVAGN